MRKHGQRCCSLLFSTGAFLFAPLLWSGEFSSGADDPLNPFDAPIPGFVGPGGIGLDPDYHDLPENFLNPLFFDWASGVSSYSPTLGVSSSYSNPAAALGPATGFEHDVVSLGDLDQSAINNGESPGSITLTFSRPIRNLSGADFAVFENSFFNGLTTFAELAYVEVSHNGSDFVRFDSFSGTANPVPSYGGVDPTDLYNLAGKHRNHFGTSWGTPFDLSEVGLDEATHIRLVDIPGSGDFLDAEGNPIYDAWHTFGSGGFDLEAIGVISSPMNYSEWPLLDSLPANQRGAMGDPDGDGLPNLLEYAFARLPFKTEAGETITPVRTIQTAGGEVFLELTFTRDERAIDLQYAVQASSDLRENNWETIAVSVAGEPVQGLGDPHPIITEESQSDLASVGVIRRVVVRDVQPLTGQNPRFLRIQVTLIPGD